ncbi:helix-turn-helix domain-containing protein [Streptomyces sp. NPDC057623]|uniref:helix-turn-helix domain-containing protein n=1 Tax=Streptomyces sp. NPDC057623 TaxID=3346187 RepID=UPI0036B1C861
MGQQTRLEQRFYRNPSRSGLRVEVLSYADFRHRLTRPEFTRLHRLDFHHLTLVDQGEGTITVDFVDHPCRPGTLLHVRPGQVQRLPVTSDGSPADLGGTLILFTGDFLSRPPAASMPIDDPFGPTAWQLAGEDHNHFRRAFADLANGYALPSGQAPDIVRELLRHLLSALLLRITLLPAPEDFPQPTGATEEPYRLFRHELERSFAVRHHAHDYATALGYSLKTLNRSCTRATGQTAKQLIDNRVSLEAKRLLAHTDLPVASIGHRLGFTEPTNFGKFFTRATGQTPGAFRGERTV